MGPVARVSARGRHASAGALRAYVGIIAAAGLSVSVVRWDGWSGPHRWWIAVLVLALMVHSSLVRVRFRYGGQTDELNFFESALAVSFVVFRPAEVTVLCALAVAAVLLRERVQPLKATFNVCQWLLAASVGDAVYTTIVSDRRSTATVAAGVVAGACVAWLVNQITISGALWLASGHPVGAGERRRAAAVVTWRAVGVVVSLSFALILTGLYLWATWSLALAFLPIAMLHWASRGYAEVRADQARLTGLQRATHALAVSLDEPDAYARFLDEVGRSFEVSSVELWFCDDSGHAELVRSTGTTRGGDSRPLVVRLLAEADVRRIEPGEGELGELLGQTGYRNCLAAPLRSGHRTVGVLCLFDRIGMEGFEEGERAVASALASELVGFRDRSQLVGRLISERRTLSQIIDTTSDGIVSIAADGTIRSWNAGLAAMTGYTTEEMVGTSHLGLLRLRDETGRDVFLERWATGLDLPTEVQTTTSTGETVWLSCSYSPVSEADVLVVVARNVSKARELQQLKDEFVAVVSHELRTPLSSIKGWSSTMLAKGDRMTDAQRRDGLQAVIRQSQRLEQLIMNILEASRIEAGARPVAEDLCDVAATAAKVVSEALAVTPDRVVRVHAQSPVLAQAADIWVERIITNLVGNAIKYSPAEEPVDVVVEQRAGAVVITVTDRGPGIPTEDQERIFDRFERLASTATQTGTGLGLYITRQLARTMGGDVRVDSVVGAGSTFVVTLPDALAPLPAPRLSNDLSGMPMETPNLPAS